MDAAIHPSYAQRLGRPSTKKAHTDWDWDWVCGTQSKPEAKAHQHISRQRTPKHDTHTHTHTDTHTLTHTHTHTEDWIRLDWNGGFYSTSSPQQPLPKDIAALKDVRTVPHGTARIVALGVRAWQCT